VANALETLINSLESITLADVDKEIEGIDAKIKEATESLMKRRDALIGARRLIVLRTEGMPQRKPRGPRSDKGTKKPRKTDDAPASPSSELPKDNPSLPLVKRVIAYLQGIGPARPGTIARGLSEEVDDVQTCLTVNKSLFEKIHDGTYALRGSK